MKIKKCDIILAVIIAIVGLVFSVYFIMTDTSASEDTVVINVDGEKYGEYSLAKDQEIEVKQGDNAINKVTIKDGNVQMTFANCKNQDCVKQGRITSGNEAIICLPHKMVVEIKSNDSEYDAVSQ